METLVLTPTYEEERNKPMPSKNHAILQKRLIVALSVRYNSTYEILSEISLDLDDWQSTPDLAIYPKMQIDFNSDEIRLTEAPLGVIEILSPTQTLQELTDKIAKYFKAGTSSCWLLLPTLQSIFVFSDAKTHAVFQEHDLLEDKKLNIQLDLKEIFGNPS
ncbi:MAG: Uma2 family endonuclease [Verrucomicrobia bacterium]|nr:Uma2 family endonuclease [Cytophagales bacterium]